MHTSSISTGSERPTLAEKWLRQNRDNKLVCLTIFKDFSVVYWDSEIFGWSLRQLTSKQFLQAVGLIGDEKKDGERRGAPEQADVATMVDAMLDWHAGMHRAAFDADAARVNYTCDQYEHQRGRLLTAYGEIVDALDRERRQVAAMRAALENALGKIVPVFERSAVDSEEETALSLAIDYLEIALADDAPGRPGGEGEGR